ncbi:MAG: BspA family leucine-rich repeat surface protein [Bacteroidales bacterium]|nr:BspA family leucine-rich repeat surface protein [Bacteroidales bacterium]
MEQIHYKSDFSIALTDREEYPWLRSEGDFEINVTSELPDEATKRVTAKRASGVLSGCELRGGAVYIAIVAGTLDPGEVWVEIAADIPDEDTGTTRHISESWQIGIELTATGPAGGATVVTMEVLEAKITAALGEVIDKYGIVTAATAWDERIAALDQALADGAGVASDQSATIAELNATISGLNTTIGELNDTISDKDSEIEGLNTTISGFDDTLAAKDATISEKEGTITELNGTIDGLNSTIDGLNDTIAEKDAEIEASANYKFICDNIVKAGEMFSGNTNIKDVYLYFPKCTYCYSMFSNTYVEKLSGYLGTDFYGLFYNVKSESVDYSELDTSNVTSIRNMFRSCVNMKSIDLTGMNTSNVTSLEYMCTSCSSLASFTFGGMDTSKVTHFDYTFNGCTSLETLDFRGQDFSSVKYTMDLFSGCTSLKTIYFDEDALPQLYQLQGMFDGCTALEFVYGSIHVDCCTSGGYWGNYTLRNCDSLLRLHIKGLGTISGWNYAYFAATNWGSGWDENRQSLVDSLVNDSFDRATAGYISFTLYLRQDVIDRLTATEKTQITAKGYTITAY